MNSKKPEFEIILTDKSMAVKSGSPNFEALMCSCLNAILNEAFHILSHFEENTDDENDNAEVAKGALFDMMNLAFSNTLHAFDPTVDLHPEMGDLMDIIEEENTRLTEALESDPEKFKELVKGDETPLEEIQNLSKVSSTSEESN